MINKHPETNYPGRHQMRLRDYDYSWNGAYYVTICTNERRNLFGSIENSSMILNAFGEITSACWKDIPNHYSNVQNEIYIVMPNHVHGIVIIGGTEGRAGSKPKILHPLSEIVRAIKTYSSRRINELRNTPGVLVWQRGYYEHVIRSESDFQQIGEYIQLNPAKWESDRENPKAIFQIPPLSFEQEDSCQSNVNRPSPK